MMLATFESAGSTASFSAGPTTLLEALVGGDRLLDVELDDLHLSIREDVRLPRRRNADRLGHRERRLALRRDDPVHVELALSPDVEVLLVPGPDNRARVRREPPREHRDDDVDLVARGARDHERGVFEPRLLEHSPAGAVRLDGPHVVSAAERLEPARVHVDHRQLVLVVERPHDRGAHLPRADDEDPHRQAEANAAASRIAGVGCAGAAAEATAAGSRAGARHARALRNRLRQRRLLDLLRARRHGGIRARAHADRLRHRRADLRGDLGDLRGGNRPLPGGRRLVQLRPPRLQRARQLRRRLGADARLRRDRRDLGVLRPALPVRLLGAAAREPVGHRRRRDRRRPPGRDQHRGRRARPRV